MYIKNPTLTATEHEKENPNVRLADVSATVRSTTATDRVDNASFTKISANILFCQYIYAENNQGYSLTSPRP